MWQNYKLKASIRILISQVQEVKVRQIISDPQCIYYEAGNNT